MLYKILVNLYVSLFVPKCKRANTKHQLLGIFNRLYIQRRACSVGNDLYCDGTRLIKINKKTKIGSDVHINGLIILGSGDVRIGDHVHIGMDCLICSDSHNYEGDFIPYDGTVIAKETIIDDFSWIGARVTILPGTKIGEGAIIQAGSVVHGNIPAYSIAGGNPASVFKMRNIEHFLKLKAEGKIWDKNQIACLENKK